MNLNLKRPIAFFDLETTGLNIAHDRIVEIAILRIDPDGKETPYQSFLTPKSTSLLRLPRCMVILMSF